MNNAWTTHFVHFFRAIGAGWSQPAKAVAAAPPQC